MRKSLRFTRHIGVIILTLGLIAVAAWAQPRSSFTAGPVTARAGERTSGLIQVPALNDEGTTVPISVVHGVRSGPVLALIAGNHGYEYAPIIALQRLLPQIDPKHVAGTVIMVHVANMPSFLRRTIYY
ncbi:MAG: hypothetical protein ACRENG_29425, partial [bacterium]